MTSGLRNPEYEIWKFMEVREEGMEVQEETVLEESGKRKPKFSYQIEKGKTKIMTTLSSWKQNQTILFIRTQLKIFTFTIYFKLN